MDDQNTVNKIGKIKNDGAKWLKDHVMYVVVFLASFVIVVFLPMIGSNPGAWAFKDYNFSKWCWFIGTKIIVSSLNTSIFAAFNKQGEINSYTNEKYKKAKEMLLKIENKEKAPISPNVWKKKQYLTKGIGIAVGTILTLLVFTNPNIVYDLPAMLTYIVTIVLAIIFGFLQMTSAEDYWCNEFYLYAVYITQKKEQKESEGKKDVDNK